jgi:hypothetical protein
MTLSRPAGLGIKRIVFAFTGGVDEGSTCSDPGLLEASVVVVPHNVVLLDLLLSSPRWLSFALMGAKM